MTDPNVTYKLAFADLTRELGRLPTPNECLEISDAYKKSWGPAEETAAAGRPEPEGFSRQPAPQARAIGADTPAREDEEWLAEACNRVRIIAEVVAEVRLSGPDKTAEADQAASSPEPPTNKPEDSERAMVVASSPCRRCGRAFERVARRGRPPVVCEECR